MPFYERGDVRIRYEEHGAGFPLLVTPGGGLNSRVSNWPTAVINAMEAFKDDFRCITMDQRNANGGESSGPIPVADPWGGEVRQITGPAKRGLNRALVMLGGSGGRGRGGRGGPVVAPMATGDYVVTVDVAGEKLTKRARVRERIR